MPRKTKQVKDLEKRILDLTAQREEWRQKFYSTIEGRIQEIAEMVNDMRHDVSSIEADMVRRY